MSFSSLRDGAADVVIPVADTVSPIPKGIGSAGRLRLSVAADRPM